eukprot:scaffold5680_cov122-Isochrysis_galbana.AAC.7
MGALSRRTGRRRELPVTGAGGDDVSDAGRRGSNAIRVRACGPARLEARRGGGSVWCCGVLDRPRPRERTSPPVYPLPGQVESKSSQHSGAHGERRQGAPDGKRGYAQTAPVGEKQRAESKNRPALPLPCHSLATPLPLPCANPPPTAAPYQPRASSFSGSHTASSFAPTLLRCYPTRRRLFLDG